MPDGKIPPSRKDFAQLSDYLWEVPRSFRSDMRVPARVFTSARMLDDILRDRSLLQLVNVATLPGIRMAALAMPDIHEGYGFPIGGVAATAFPDGAISPGGIGYDINCGVRLLKSDLDCAAVQPYLQTLAERIYREVPSGVGRGGALKLDNKVLDRALQRGAVWAVEQGYGEPSDPTLIESAGAMPDADPDAVSTHAKDRGRDQLGTVGSGNHFLEVDVVDQVFDPPAAERFGLRPGQIVLQIHTGSRGLGHQVATDYIRIMLNSLGRQGIPLADRELAYAPFSSPEGKEYFGAMAAGANFAWANRQLITASIRRVWRDVLGDSGGPLRILYDLAHNVAKVEEHEIDGRRQRVIVHRKGATRAFGPGSAEVPERYRETGQPVIIPGSMGTASYVLAGTAEGMRLSFGSSCHGAGRRMSRAAAKKQVQGRELLDRLAQQGIVVQAGSLSGVAEEAPLAYKDVDDVVEVVDRAGLARRVARLRPLAVVKG